VSRPKRIPVPPAGIVARAESDNVMHPRAYRLRIERQFDVVNGNFRHQG
jgi:hypothetical protein